jgi:dolichyl-phosphate-mannose--protein O-mannosyl transferase
VIEDIYNSLENQKVKIDNNCINFIKNFVEIQNLVRSKSQKLQKIQKLHVNTCSENLQKKHS